MKKKDLNNIVGRNIKKYRLLYNKKVGKMTQEDLAESINSSVSLISSLESPKSSQGIRIYYLYKISSVLNIPIDNFFVDE